MDNFKLNLLYQFKEINNIEFICKVNSFDNDEEYLLIINKNFLVKFYIIKL